MSLTCCGELGPDAYRNVTAAGHPWYASPEPTGLLFLPPPANASIVEITLLSLDSTVRPAVLASHSMPSNVAGLRAEDEVPMERTRGLSRKRERTIMTMPTSPWMGSSIISLPTRRSSFCGCVRRNSRPGNARSCGRWVSATAPPERGQDTRDRARCSLRTHTYAEDDPLVVRRRRPHCCPTVAVGLDRPSGTAARPRQHRRELLGRCLRADPSPRTGTVVRHRREGVAARRRPMWTISSAVTRCHA